MSERFSVSGMTQKSIKNTFDQMDQMDQISQQYRKAFEEVATKADHIDDSQIAAVFEMLGTYRDICEQMALHPFKVASKETQMVRKQFSLLKNTAMRAVGRSVSPVAVPDGADRRFSDQEWSDNILFDYLKQAYLINANTLLEMVSELEGTQAHTRDQFVFYTRQLVNALSPSNFALTNPEVLRKTFSSKGKNLVEGVKNFWDDFKSSPQVLNISMTDFSAFRVGQNVATTPGKVVYQTDLMQLIQYEPTTEKVQKTPILIIPPWINKYYILDLTAKNSLVKWLVDQGFTVFMTSWVNPGPALKNKGFEHYMQDGPLSAFSAIEKATGESEIHAVGYCVGGTLLACTLAYLKDKGESRTVSATYLTTLLDFSDPGGIGVFINDHTIGGIEKRLDKAGYYDGRSMAFSFNMLRENDLFWSFFINNYLKGEKPAAFDLLYWNSDSTNLPAKMHGWYLRHMYLDNELIQPGKLELMGVKLDLGKIDTPVFFLSTIQDHIAKWKATYLGAKAHNGDVTFVLSGSGHIAGVVNPPGPEKYGYWTNAELSETSDSWFNNAEKHKGSWWPAWKTWLLERSDEVVEARQPGDRELECLEDAPGSYVRMRIADVVKETGESD
ncbi:poly(3-hydroxyalkanoate) synthetase [Oleiphilus messinensis]|uniref:Poly(3-hydroxyalkanoate) synthetase n=1 Tax=Oleiphilus messinensis TaxID=141451 RepID=A0A1Y0ID64_9GAMM|nr:class I poly(R)-hydroxyalkanoic acid synthase [Oleiphilus messinensis]ARU57323.1 poly(3-hydroxyalkanoate) synthetase [Oleiphilus messinensis]